MIHYSHAFSFRRNKHLILLVVLLLCASPSQLPAAFSAYNDCAWTANSGQNPSANDITGNFTTNGPLGPLSGSLMNLNGQSLSVQVTFITNNAVGVGLLDRAFGPPSGSDADTWFTGKIGTNCAANWSAGSIQMIFSGLNTNKLYNIVLWSTRGADSAAYSNRFTDITLSGAGGFTNRSSTGAELFDGGARTRLRSGVAAGLVARYDNVVPSATGMVSFTLSAGGDLLWPSAGVTTNGYLNAIAIQELDTQTGVSVWRQAQLTGTLNASSCLLYLYTSNTTASVYMDDFYMCQGSTAESGANLITNPGFESGTNGWEMVGVFAGVSQPVGTYQRSGSSSLLLQASAPVSGGGSANSVKQNVLGLTSGAVHTLSFWYLATNAVDFIVRYSGHPAMAVLTQVGSQGTTTNGGTTNGFEISGAGLVSSNGNLRMSWIATTGKLYRVMTRSSLVSGSWQEYSRITAAVANATIDVPVSAMAGFYRLIEATMPPSAFYQIHVGASERFGSDYFMDYGNSANFASTYVFVSDPVPGNHAPVINSIGAIPAISAAMSNVALSVSATDPDGDPLQYFWVAPAGQMGWSRASNETWRAASVGATYTLQVMVGDGKAWTSSYVNVQVTNNSFTPPFGDHPVAVTSVKAAKTTVSPGEAISVTFTRYDCDPPVSPADSSNAWGCSGGAISGATTNFSITWTAPSVINTSTNRPSKPGYVLWPRLPTDWATCPIPLSTGLVAVGLVGRVSHQHVADTFMPCWAADGSLYSAYQDGRLCTPPFYGTNDVAAWYPSDPIYNGWCRILGDDPMDLVATAGGKLTSDKGSWTGRYPNAVIHVNGTLYFGTRLTANNGTMYPAGPNVGYHVSNDGGSNWTSSPYGPSSYLFGTQDPPSGPQLATRFGQTYLVDYGKNQERSPDGKIYLVSAGSPTNDPDPGAYADDHVYLCRVSAANLNNAAGYEYYAGSGNWSSSLSAAQPILTWSNHISAAAVTYNPGLNKYIMSCHKAHGWDQNGTRMVGMFDTYILESSSLTGPYNLVQYWTSFGQQGYYPNIPSKFVSTDGKTAWLWYGSNYNSDGVNLEEDPFGSGYRLVEQELRFLTPAEIAVAP